VLDNIAVVTSSWLALIEANRYTEAIVRDITELQKDTAITLSCLPEYLERPQPEDTNHEHMLQQVSSICDRYTNLKVVVDSVMKPSRLLKRKASDDCSECPADGIDEVADDGPEPQHQQAASSSV